MRLQWPNQLPIILIVILRVAISRALFILSLNISMTCAERSLEPTQPYGFSAIHVNRQQLPALWASTSTTKPGEFRLVDDESVSMQHEIVRLHYVHLLADKKKILKSRDYYNGTRLFTRTVTK